MKKWSIISLLLITSLIVLYQFKVPHVLLGKYLSPSDTLTQSDAIVVVSGDIDRMKHAIDLYKQGYADKVILSGAAREGITSNALAMHIEASAAGIPDSSVIMEEKATNTYENALFIKKIITAQGIDNVILVTSPYHQRRVYQTFLSVFKGSNVKFQNSPSHYSDWKPENWWQTDRGIYLTKSESAKILWTNIIGKYQ
jgi:uncharacterized SAM-binding protein YcdF (DUF218 family)